MSDLGGVGRFTQEYAANTQSQGSRTYISSRFSFRTHVRRRHVTREFLASLRRLRDVLRSGSLTLPNSGPIGPFALNVLPNMETDEH